MKLYCTATSERASKSQGGNNYLDIEIFTGSRKKSIPLASFRVEKGLSPDTDKPAYILRENETGEVIRWQDIQPKQKKNRAKKVNRQKGTLQENCPHAVTSLESFGTCSDCGKSIA